MSKRRRRSCTPQFKAEVVLEVLSRLIHKPADAVRSGTHETAEKPGAGLTKIGQHQRACV